MYNVTVLVNESGIVGLPVYVISGSIVTRWMLEIFGLNSTVTLLNYWIHNWWPHVVTTCADHVWWLHVEPTCSVLMWWPSAVTTDGEKMCGDHVVTRCGWQHVVTMCGVHVQCPHVMNTCGDHVRWARVVNMCVTAYGDYISMVTMSDNHVRWPCAVSTCDDHVRWPSVDSTTNWSLMLNLLVNA